MRFNLTYLHSRRGFTLVELLVAMALIVLISTAFLGMYHTGVLGISRAGTRSNNIHESQEDIENAILDGTTASDSITITLTSDGSTIIVPGEVRSATYDNVTLRMFLPANK